MGLRDRNSQSFRPRLSVLRSMSASYAPGATLANVCQTLARLLKLLPDLEYDPDAPIPPNTPEFPSLPTASADLPSAAPLTPATPLPNNQQSLCQDAVFGVRRPCCRFSSPTPAPSTNPAPSSSYAASAAATPPP